MVGDGSDTAVYKGLRANYTVTRNNDGSYTVTDNTANGTARTRSPISSSCSSPIRSSP